MKTIVIWVVGALSALVAGGLLKLWRKTGISDNDDGLRRIPKAEVREMMRALRTMPKQSASKSQEQHE